MIQCPHQTYSNTKTKRGRNQKDLDYKMTFIWLYQMINFVQQNLSHHNIIKRLPIPIVANCYFLSNKCDSTINYL